MLGDLSDIAGAFERIEEQENEIDLLKLEIKQVNTDLDSERMASQELRNNQQKLKNLILESENAKEEVEKKLREC